MTDPPGVLDQTRTVDKPADVAELVSQPTVAASAAVLAIGSQVGRYVVVSELGQGGMGAVYLAFDPQLERKVALKLLHMEASDDQLAIVRLQREAQALARVSHPNTVAVYDVGNHQGQVFIAMEHVEGITLRQWLKEKPRSWREIVKVLRGAGEGLAAVHAAGLVHRDFKPTNVVVTAEERAKVLDFGLARLSSAESVATPQPLAAPKEPQQSPDSSDSLESQSNRRSSSGFLDTPLTRAGNVSGTLGYLAPELLEGHPATPAADQFAFGVTLYQALYGQKPMSAQNFGNYIKALQTSAPGVPRFLAEVTRRCLSFAPESRYPSMREVVEALGRDPTRVWRTRALLAGVVVAMAAAAWAGATFGHRVDCPSEAQRLQTLWTDSTRSTLENGLLTARPQARMIVTNALDMLEKSVRKWAKDSAFACVAAGKKEATRTDSLRVTCLARQGPALGVLIESLRKPDTAVASRSDELVETFLSDSGCDTAAQLSRVHADDVADQYRDLAVTIRAHLHRSLALYILGRYSEAETEAQAAKDKAHQAKLTGFEAESVFRLAKLYFITGREPQALLDYVTSFNLAVAAGTDVQALASCAMLVERLVEHKGRGVEAKIYSGTCEALFERLGSPEVFERDILIIRAAIAKLEGRQEDVIPLGERAYEVTRRVNGERSLAMARTLGSLGYAYAHAGRIVEGNKYRARAIDLLLALKGPDEPNLVPRYEYLGYGLMQEGRQEEALDVLERGHKLAEKLDSFLGYKADIKRRLSFALEGVDEPRALALAEESLRMYEKGSDQFEVAKSLYAQARALTALGRQPEALKDCQRARQIDVENQDYEGIKRRAAAQCEAEALISTNPKAAAQAWERGLQVTPPDVLAHVRATFNFGLAQALRLSKGDEKRASELAKQALQEYAPLPAFAERRALIEKWIAAAPE